MHTVAALTEFFYSRDVTPRTREWYEKHLTTFLDWCASEGVDDVADINLPLVRRYLAHLAETTSRFGKPLSSQTRHGCARAIRAFTNYCWEDGLMERQLPWKKAMPKREQYVKPVFSPREIDALLRACKDLRFPMLAARDRAIVTMLMDTGIRADELCTLTLDRVHFGLAEAFIVVNGKGRKQREVGLGKASRLALHRYVHEYRPAVDYNEVFISRLGLPMSVNGLQEVLLKLGEKTRLPIHVNPHTFRHTFAYTYMKTGAGDVLRLSRVLGHTSVVVTEQYLKMFDSSDARDSASVLDTMQRRR